MTTHHMTWRHRAAPRNPDLSQLLNHLPHLPQGPSLCVDADGQGRHPPRAATRALADNWGKVWKDRLCRPSPLASPGHKERSRREGLSLDRGAACGCRARCVGVDPRVEVGRAQDVLRHALDERARVPGGNRRARDRLWRWELVQEAAQLSRDFFGLHRGRWIGMGIAAEAILL